MAGIEDYIGKQKFIQIADTIEMQGGQPSIEYGFLESVAMGAAGAGYSAVAGLLNTGVALGESLGVFQEGEYGFDTYGALESTLGTRTAQFYADHKTGIDAIGLVAGSLVPGMLAVKALRVAQIAGRIPGPAQVATGLKNADLVLGSKSVEAAKQAVLRSGNILHTPQVYAAARTGFKQQVLENIAFEVGMLTTMNQSATLNPDGLGYFDAMATQFKEGLPFLGIGIGLGTAIDSMRIVGAIKKFESAEMLRTGKYSAVTLEVMAGLQPGDKLAFAVQESKKRAEFLAANPIQTGDFAAERALKEGDTIVRTEFMRAIGEMNFADEAGRLALEDIVKKATTGQLSDVGTLVAGLSKVQAVSAADVTKLSAFYAKTASPSVVIRTAGDEPAVLRAMAANHEDRIFKLINDATEVFGRDKAPDFVVDYLDGKAVTLDLALGDSMLGGASHGAARSGSPVGHGLIVGFTGRSGKREIIVRSEMYAPALTDQSAEVFAQKNNSVRRALGLPEMSVEEYNEAIYFHELGHVKKNDPKFMEKTMKLLTSGSDSGMNMVGEILNATYEMRGDSFMEMLGQTLSQQHGAAFAEGVIRGLGKALKGADVKQRQSILRDFLGEGILDFNKNPVNTVTLGGKSTTLVGRRVGYVPANAGYYFGLQELMADTMALLTSPVTRERFARVSPNLSNLINKHGGIVQAWSDNKAYYNRRTGEIAASMLPGIADVANGNMRVVGKKAEISLVVPGLNRTFKFNSEAFKELAGIVDKGFKSIRSKKPDYLEFEAQWIMAAKQDIAELIVVDEKTKVKRLLIRNDNLPVLERVFTDKKLRDSGMLDQIANGGNLRLLNVEDGTERAISIDGLRDHIVSTKRTFRNALGSTGMMNEAEIAKILNIETMNARGDFMDDGWMLMDKKDMSKAEIVAMNYKPMDMGNVEASVKSQAAVDARNQLLQHNRNLVAAETLGSMDSLLPEITVEEIAVMSRLSSRATLVSNVRSAFGSVREKMQFVGRLVEKAAQQKVQEVADEFAQFSSTLNRPDMMQARYELAQIDNLIRREWYHKYGNYIVRKSAIQDAADAAEVDFATVAKSLQDNPDFAEELLGNGDKFAPDAVKLSDEVSRFYDMHKRRNGELVTKKRAIAASKGKQAMLDEEVLYPPPRDLTKSKYVGFIAPKAYLEGSDNRKFMIFAESQTEYDAKVAAIRGKYGNQYEIFSRSEVAEYKKYVGEYNEGLVFDEIFFDSEVRRAGTASEILPSLDLQVSGTLSRYQDFHVRQETAMLRAGVEAKYGESVQYLRQMDEVTGAAERDTLSKKFKAGATIYQDSLALMLGKRASSGPVEDMWVRVNDYIGQKGSNLIDSIFGVLRNDVSEGVTKEALETFNDSLESQGFKAPFAGVMESILISPDPEVSRALPSLVRTLNNLAGTMMLRLDMAHSMVSLMSTPILAMPVLLEAKDALRGTARGRQLDMLTSVVHPTTGVKEPNAIKLMMRGVKNFWSPSGKEFMAQLRERGIVNDYLRQYQEVMDFNQLNGRHQMKQINDKIDRMAEFGSKWSGFTMTEELTRFTVAHAAYEIGTMRGLQGNELWSVVASAVDKVHGIYIGHQRPQLFQGAMGQAIGLYQTYFFNFMQNAMKYVADGNKRQGLAMAGLQASIFGLQSMPGFHTFNQLVGETNRENLDLYSVTNADDPKSMGAYFLYGLGSHALGVPVDFYTRGDLAIRNSTIVPNPLNPMEIPALGMVVRAVGNMYNTIKLASQDNVPAGTALLHGLAHNGMNRPMQGLATILQGRVTSGKGMTYFENSNYVGYDTPDPDKSMIDHALSGEINFGGMFARLIGTRPLNESIIANHYFRQAAYQTSTRKQIESIGARMQLSMETGSFNGEAAADFMLKYERAGGDIQNFNAYMSRQFQNTMDGTMTTFRREMEVDSAVSRAYNRMLIDRTNKAPWEYGEE